MKTINSLLILLALVSFSCKKSQKKEIIDNKKLPVFNFSPKKPIDGKLLGVVELGAAGFNSFIISVDEAMNWQLVEKEYGNSLIVEGMTNTELVNQKLRDYLDKISAHGLSKKNIHFVVSSGAAKEEITQIIAKELENIGYEVNTVTAEEEGLYALRAILYKEFINNSFVVDFGSGNTKISYFKSDGTPVTLETHGAKYYQKGIEDEQVFNDIKKLVAKIPLEKRVQCFMIGGVPTKLAEVTQEKEELFTVLNPDAKMFEKAAIDGGKKIQSGLNIYKAIQEGTDVEKLIYFKDGNFTVGFLLEKNN